jgi:hypothetical protein
LQIRNSLRPVASASRAVPITAALTRIQVRLVHRDTPSHTSPKTTTRKTGNATREEAGDQPFIPGHRRSPFPPTAEHGQIDTTRHG